MDIVERLRRDAWNPEDDRTKAADEIERLRAENAHQHHQTNKLGEEILKLRTENAALRKVLKKALKALDFRMTVPEMDAVIAEARAVLEETR